MISSSGPCSALGAAGPNRAVCGRFAPIALSALVLLACGNTSRDPHSSEQSEGGAGASPGGEAATGGNAGSAAQAAAAGKGPTAGAGAGGDAPDGCPQGSRHFDPGCTFAPAPEEGCYSSCAEEPCAQGECLYLSVPTQYEDDFIPPDATCGERHPLCVDAPLCVAGSGPSWTYLDAVSNSAVLRSYIDGSERSAGVLRLFDASASTDSEVCVVELPPCASDGVDLDDVNRLMADAAMQEILTAGVLYGYRGSSGSVVQIRGDSSFVEVGQPCEGRDSCRAIEPKLAELAARLRLLTDAALADERCSSAPPVP